jgi:GNAT superfamily N-acetyltransferase
MADPSNGAQRPSRDEVAARLRIDVESPESPDALWCRDQYFAEIDSLFDHGYDPEAAIPAAAPDLTPPLGAFLVARFAGSPVGCGGVKLPPGEPAFLKRMWVVPAMRGLGISARLLDELEALARVTGAPAITLDTNSKLAAAAGLYLSRGYREVPDFNGEPHADRWYRKDL